ncbi:MAG: hypothetical protein MI867_03105 [Pseudomonadales bacterium]|nr:hypothetical protein [Pseudomonadales bacterium]
MAPQNVLMLACFVSLMVLFASSQYLSQLPYYASQVKVDGKHLSVLISAEKSSQEESIFKHIKGVLVGDSLVPITPKHLSDDPDFIRSFAELTQYFHTQQQLFDIFAGNNSVTLLTVDNEQVNLQRRDRNLSDLPITFWMLQAYGTLAMLTGMAFWVYHRKKAVTRILAVGGIGCYIMQVSQSVYASREFAMHSEVFECLLHTNHFGGILFVYSFAMLFWFYPNPIQKPKLVLWLSTVPVAVWSNELLQWIEWPISLFYFPAIILATFTFILLRLQWACCKNNPQQKLLFLWLVNSVLAGLGLTLVVYIVPILIWGQPFVSTWLANTFCLLVFLGFVLGVHYGGLFAVERWWLKACFNILLAIAVILLDLLAIALLGAQAALGFGLLAVICFWLYLLARSRFWSFIAGDNGRDIALANMLVEPTSNQEIDPNLENQPPEIEMLRVLYSPLSINVVERRVSKPCIEESGLKLMVTLEHQDELNSYEIVGKQMGQKVFHESDSHFVANFLAHSQNIDKLHQEREATLVAERQRIMRDLHDEVAPDLLGLVHLVNQPQEREQAQKCLKNLREIVYSMDDNQHRLLTDALANWRYEISQMIEAAGGEVDWCDDGIDPQLSLTGGQWLQLSRILRELVANAVKHAVLVDSRASKKAINDKELVFPISINFSFSEQTLSMQVINQNVALDSNQWELGKGLHSIQRRVKDLFGSVNWQVDAGQCCVSVSIPLTSHLKEMS